MSGIKQYICFDVTTTIGLIVLYFTTRGTLDQIHSPNMNTFYMVEIGFAILVQVLLIVAHV